MKQGRGCTGWGGRVLWLKALVKMEWKAGEVDWEKCLCKEWRRTRLELIRTLLWRVLKGLGYYCCGRQNLSLESKRVRNCVVKILKPQGKCITHIITHHSNTPGFFPTESTCGLSIFLSAEFQEVNSSRWKLTFIFALDSATRGCYLRPRVGGADSGAVYKRWSLVVPWN